MSDRRRALIFANGDLKPGDMLDHTLNTLNDSSDNPLIVAADGGARLADKLDLSIDLLIGDMDSLTADEVSAIGASGAEVKRFSPQKDETDLELALKIVVERGVNWIRIIGATGGRLDQALGNVYLLTLPYLHDVDVRLIAGDQETRLLSAGQHLIHGNEGDTVSLLPIGGDALDIKTENLYYPLTHEPLFFGPARGISNVMTADSARVTFDAGRLLLIHTIGRA